MDVKVKFEHPTMNTHEVYAKLVINTKLFEKIYRKMKFIHAPDDPNAFVVKMEDQLTASWVYRIVRDEMDKLYSGPVSFVTNDLNKFEKICYEYFNGMYVEDTTTLRSTNIYREASLLKYDPTSDKDESQQFLDLHGGYDNNFSEYPNILKMVSDVHWSSIPVLEKIKIMAHLNAIDYDTLEFHEKLLGVNKFE